MDECSVLRCRYMHVVIHGLQADRLHDMTRNAAAGFVGGLVGVAVLATIGLAIRGVRNHK